MDKDMEKDEGPGGQEHPGEDASAEGLTPEAENFNPLVLEKTVIAWPLFQEFEKKEAERKAAKKDPGVPVYPVIIDVNLLYPLGREEAKKEVQQLVVRILNAIPDAAPGQGVSVAKTRFSQQYVFATLQEAVIKELVRQDGARTSPPEGVTTEPGGAARSSGWKAIYHIWPDFEIKQLTTKSVSTVKADAARNAFSALGREIYWAVMDSGIDGSHPHFKQHGNLDLPGGGDPLRHRDFTVLTTEPEVTNEDITRKIDLVGSGSQHTDEKPLEDELGHGTHVAGIIAGELRSTTAEELKALEGKGVDDRKDAAVTKIAATTLKRDENKNVVAEPVALDAISGMAPYCKLVSLKVLDRDGRGQASNLIAAIQWIQEVNGYGRMLRIHGVNMSVGYEFEPQWFACGQSPLCVEVDRLVKTGVVVVVAAGNTGYGFVQAHGKKNAVTAGLDLTINDPGNADLAITVGSTHRDMPHVYGVSYFSSKGPTGDGRLKPDLVAPGEKIISCDSAQRRARLSAAGSAAAAAPAPEGTPTVTGYYREDSGTSMAAPHVSGVIAAFLSVRREFIGKPEVVKEIFLSTATDLKRERYFQGHGLVDLMRAIQSV